MAGAEAPRPVRTCRYFGYRGRRVRSVWRVRVYLDRVRVADAPRTKLPESRNRRSSFATGFNTLKHVSVLYEFSTLIEPEDVSASPRPVDPATPEKCSKAGRLPVRAVPLADIIFRRP